MNSAIKKYIPQIKISYKNNVHPEKRVTIDSSLSAYLALIAHWDRKRIELVEESKIILLDQRKTCLGISSISLGGISATAVDAKIVLATALLARASGIILSHNHPSCQLTPSTQDIAVTDQIAKAAKLHDMYLVDHIIVSPHGYYSFAEKGEMPSLII